MLDEYVPITITWPEARRLLDAPRYLSFGGSGRLLELKFHPQTRLLVEAVLVSAAGVQQGGGSLSPESADGAVSGCLAQDDASVAERNDLSRLVVYDDCLLIGFGRPVPARWVGSRPVLLGVDDLSMVIALCVMWEPRERETFLSHTS